MANELVVYEHSDESLLSLQLMGAGETIGAWLSPDNWAFNESGFDSGFTMYADGVEVENVKVIAQTDYSNPQAAVLWPHITDNDFGTVSNKMEIWLEHDPIDRDAVVTFDLAANVATQGGFGNAASTAQAADEQLSTYKADFLDHIKSTATGVFLSKTGTLPKMPYLEKDLGSADHTYADAASIPGGDIDGSAPVLFAIDVNLSGYSPEGVVFEYGDSTNGVSAIFSGDRLYIKAGSATNSLSVDRTTNNVGFMPIESTYTIGVLADPVAGTLKLFLEGHEMQSDSGIMDDFTSANAGEVGGANGSYMQEDTITPEPARSGFTIESSLRVYENPTLAIGIDETNSKDLFPLSYNTTIRDIYGGEAWESEITKYEYLRSDIADMRNPGDINYMRSIQGARGILTWRTGGSGNPTAKHCFIGLKPQETWGSDREKDSSGNNPSSNSYVYDMGVTGISKDEGVVFFRYGATGQVVHDWSASTLSTLPDLFNMRKVSFFFLEDRIIRVKGNPAKDGLGFQVSVSSTVNQNTWRVGGVYFEDTGGNALAYVDNDSINAGSNIYGHTWGEMCFDGIGANSFRSAAVSTGGGSETGYMTRVQFGHSYYQNDYSGEGGSGRQAHDIYIKGWVPYLRFKEAWHAGFFPGGPGGMKKMDTHKKMVSEASVGWGHKSGGGGFQNNGTNDGVVWAATTDRSRNAGRHNDHCCIKDFVWADCDDFLSSIACAVDCELRDGIICGPDHDALAFFRDTGNSHTEGEYGGDSFNSGYNRVTLIGDAPVTFRMASTDDRSINNSQAHHEAYLHRCLIISTNGPAINLESWTDDTQTYALAAAAGRVESFRISKTHIEGTTAENDTEHADFASAKLALTDPDGDVIESTVTSGTTTLVNVSNKQGDLLLEYMTAIGYTYATAATAIKAAWAAGWDTVPTGLGVREIIAGVAARVTPTNLDPADYGGELPGYPSASTPPVTAPDLSASLVGGGALSDGGSTDLGSTEEDSDLTAQITITNGGDADLDIGTLSASGSISIDSGDNPSNTTVAQGASTTVTVTASGLVVGEDITGALIIPSNDSASPFNQTFTWVVTDALPLRTTTIGICAQAGTLDLASVRAPSAMDGEFRVAVQRENGDIVQSGLTLTLASSTLVSGTVPGGLSVSRGDSIIVQTMSASPDQSGMRAVFDIIPT